MTPHSLHVPVEPAVTPSYTALQYRSDGSQVQSQDNDPDLSNNTIELSQRYDTWFGGHLL